MTQSQVVIKTVVKLSGSKTTKIMGENIQVWKEFCVLITSQMSFKFPLHFKSTEAKCVWPFLCGLSKKGIVDFHRVGQFL